MEHFSTTNHNTMYGTLLSRVSEDHDGRSHCQPSNKLQPSATGWWLFRQMHNWQIAPTFACVLFRPVRWRIREGRVYVNNCLVKLEIEVVSWHGDWIWIRPLRPSHWPKSFNRLNPRVYDYYSSHQELMYHTHSIIIIFYWDLYIRQPSL